MIQPISIETDRAQLQINQATSAFKEEIGTIQPVEMCVIASGDYNGIVVAYIRYLPSSDNLNWQVIRNDHEFSTTNHYQLYSSFTGALHGVMALAYDYVSRQV